MVIDQPGNHGFSLKVDFPGVRARERADFLIAAHRDDALAANGNRLRDAKPLIDGNDFSVG